MSFKERRQVRGRRREGGRKNVSRLESQSVLRRKTTNQGQAALRSKTWEADKEVGQSQRMI